MKIKPIEIKQINKNRFDIFMLFTRHPNIHFIAKELEYYSNEDTSLLGTILFDYTDKDYSFVILARDENKQFRCFHPKTDFKTIDDAREELINSMKWHTSQNLKIVEQGASKKGLELFKIVVSQSKIHPYFTRLSDDSQFIPSKNAIIEISNHFDDIDGNFIEQFQSKNGFDSRLWEIYLFASFIEQNFEVLRDYDRPDFFLKKDEIEIAVEAVIVARKADNPATYLNSEPNISLDKIQDKIANEMATRFSGTLTGKRGKEYWKLEHVKGKSLVFAIADFHDTASMTWSYMALVEYLYGQRQILDFDEEGNEFVKTEKIEFHTKPNGTKIPSGFFFQDKSEHISGILFSSTGTISKFTRMGIQAGFGIEKQTVIRIGDRFDNSPESRGPISFKYQVTENTKEIWSEGLNLFHNPNALIPIDKELFPEIAHHELKNGELISFVPDFHPYASMNINTIVTE